LVLEQGHGIIKVISSKEILLYKDLGQSKILNNKHKLLYKGCGVISKEGRQQMLEEDK